MKNADELIGEVKLDVVEQQSVLMGGNESGHRGIIIEQHIMALVACGETRAQIAIKCCGVNC